MAGDTKNQFKDDIVPFIFSLMTNETLTSVNLSSNAIGNAVCIAFSKVVQSNQNLTEIRFDDNNITSINSLRKFEAAFVRNKCVIKMALPWRDLNLLKVDKKDETNRIVVSCLHVMMMSARITRHPRTKRQDFRQTPDIS